MEDDAPVLTIQSGNVFKEIDDFVVEEEILDEDIAVHLNQGQIINELTHILFDTHKKTIFHKVQMYMQLIQQVQSEDPIILPQLYKVVQFTKIEFKEDDDDSDDGGASEGDAEFAASKEVDYQDLEAFMRQVYKLSKAAAPYLSTRQRLDSLFIPFLKPSTNIYAQDKTADVFRYVENTLSRIPHRLLPKDEVGYVGYYVQNQPASGAHVVFDIAMYRQALHTITEGDRVRALPRNFTPKMTGEVTGEVEEVLTEGSVYIIKTRGDVLHKVTVNDYMVYVVGSTAVTLPYELVPEDLVQRNVYFPGASEDDMRSVLPTSVSQYLYLYHKQFQTAKNWQDIHDMLHAASYRPSMLPKAAEKLIRKTLAAAPRPEPMTEIPEPVFASYYRPPPLLQFKNPHTGKSYDGDYARYKHMHASMAREHAMLLQRLAKFLDAWLAQQRAAKKSLTGADAKALEKLRDLSQRIQKGKSACPENPASGGPIRVYKVYEEYEAIERDTGKKIYADGDLDPTAYVLKSTYPDEEDLKNHLRAKNPTWTAGEVTHEATSILEGRRKIREGDHAVLRGVGRDVLFVRRKVEGKSMWVKAQELPFPWCADDLLTHEDLQQADTCLYDFKKKSCQELDLLRDIRAHDQLTTRVELIQNALRLLENADEAREALQEDLRHFNMLLKLPANAGAGTPTLSMVDGAEEDVDGDDAEDGQVHLDFQDQSHYAWMAAPRPAAAGANATAGPSDPTLDFLAIFTSFLGIELPAADATYIANWVDAKTRLDITRELEKLKKAVMAKVNQRQYQTDAAYKDKVDKALEKTLKTTEIEKTSTLYLDVVLRAMAMLVLLLIAKYPELTMTQVYPSCVKFLSYKGYPLHEKDRPKSLVRYFACLVKHITSGNDPRYQALNTKTQDELHDAMIKIMDDILQNHRALKHKVEAARAAIEARPRHVLSPHAHTWTGFRPVFEFQQAAHTPVVDFLSTMNKQASEAPALRKNLFAVPTQMNSCCMEALTPSLNYYDLFGKELETKAVKIPHTVRTRTPLVIPPTVRPVKERGPSSAKASAAATPFPQAKTITHMASERSFSPLMVPKLQAFLAANPLFQKDPIMQAMAKPATYDQDAFWNNTVLNATRDTLTHTNEFLEKLDMVDTVVFTHIENTIVFMKDMQGRLHNQRHALVDFLSHAMPRYMHCVVSLLLPSKDLGELKEGEPEIDEPLANRFKVLQLFKHHQTTLSRKPMAELLRTGLQGADQLWTGGDEIKNIAILAYVFVKFVYHLLGLYIQAGEDMEAMDEALYPNAFQQSLNGASSNVAFKNKVNVVGQLANTLYGMLYHHMQQNDTDTRAIRMRVEQFREKRKIADIAKYKTDDDERQLQMQLKKLGVKTWADVGSFEAVANDGEAEAEADAEADTYFDVRAPEPEAEDLMGQANKRQEEENMLDNYDRQEDDDGGGGGDY